MTDPDLLETEFTFLLLDKLDCKPALVYFRETLLDDAECTFTEYSSRAEVELEFELRLALEAVESSADLLKLESRLWNINQHISDQLLEEFALDLDDFF